LAVFLALQIVLALAGTSRAETPAILDQWINAQAQLHTWSAEALQTRCLKTITQPLVSTGRVWVAVPDKFRWELGQPPQTIALRLPDQLFVVYPKLKRVEKYPLNDSRPGPWRDALALLEASFPRSRAELDARFRVLSVAQTNAQVWVALQPRSAAARRFMSEIQVSFRTNDFMPASTELRFSDGSTMRNDFSHGVCNGPLPERVFDPAMDPAYTVVEPLGK
jgi:outer membrane lipoprotein-sorting protein